jgi:hypothetical protein
MFSPCAMVQENERLAEEVDQMRSGGRAADAREYRSEPARLSASCCLMSAASARDPRAKLVLSSALLGAEPPLWRLQTWRRQPKP